MREHKLCKHDALGGSDYICELESSLSQSRAEAAFWKAKAEKMAKFARDFRPFKSYDKARGEK